jgi:hypothetical protein
LPELKVSTDIATSAERAWAAIADWESQGAWMVATRVRGQPSAVGGRLEAFTGIAPVGFLDTMTITEWEPPRRCVVLHTGNVVRGTGGFEVTPRGAEGCTVTWWERVELPLGGLGKVAWLVIGPTTRLFLVVSLGRLKRLLESS